MPFSPRRSSRTVTSKSRERSLKGDAVLAFSVSQRPGSFIFKPFSRGQSEEHAHTRASRGKSPLCTVYRSRPTWIYDGSPGGCPPFPPEPVEHALTRDVPLITSVLRPTGRDLQRCRDFERCKHLHLFAPFPFLLRLRMFSIGIWLGLGLATSAAAFGLLETRQNDPNSTCLVYGIDYVDGGSYFIDSSSTSDFTAVQ